MMGIDGCSTKRTPKNTQSCPTDLESRHHKPYLDVRLQLSFTGPCCSSAYDLYVNFLSFWRSYQSFQPL
ncbi:hypothetical protein ACMD2_06247 [Ananas comosus]|uniref:Uncharacterized protein n=1 Tax=Ananas comosus TaxID=4615 RepID=A0A199VZ61_ANACO|nr:hypothetical protein ACMD2_06247 [Ananas comosus]